MFRSGQVPWLADDGRGPNCGEVAVRQSCAEGTVQFLERLQGNDLGHLDSLEVCRLTLHLFSSPACCLDSSL